MTAVERRALWHAIRLLGSHDRFDEAMEILFGLVGDERRVQAIRRLRVTKTIPVHTLFGRRRHGHE